MLIESYTDAILSYEYNFNLSVKRADSVREALIYKGISLNRIYTSPRGKYELKEYKKNKDNLANRRVIIKIVK